MPKNSPKIQRNLIFGLGATLWLIIIMVGYYYNHKPFSPQFLISTLITLWRLLIVCGTIVLSGGIGGWVYPNKDGTQGLLIWVLQAILGAGVFGYVIFFMGITVGFSLIYFGVIIFALGFIFRNYIMTWIKGWMNIDFGVSKSKLNLFLAICVGIIFCWTLGAALAPPLHFDALTYHLALPRLYLLQGNMAYTPDLIFWGMPQLLEMLFTAAMAFGGAEAATTLGWGFGILTLVGLFEFMRLKFDSRIGWVTVVCLLGGYSLVTHLSAGYTEWFNIANGFGMVVLFDHWRSTHYRHYLILAAIFAGFAFSVKYTAGLLTLMGLVIIFWDDWRNKKNSTLQDVFIFGSIVVILASPWWIKNWLAVANPFYPLLFPSGAMSQARLDYYTDSSWGNWLEMLTLPWQTTVWGIEGKVGFQWSIGPLLLGFSAISWNGWKERTKTQKLIFSTAVICTLTGFAIWAILSRLNGLLIQTRLYATFFPAWAMLGGIGFKELSEIKTTGIRFGRIAATVLVLVTLLNLIEVGQESNRKNSLGVLTGQIEISDYRKQFLGGYDTAMNAIKELPEDSRVLMLWETRSFECLPICDPDEIIDRWYDDSLRYQNAKDILSAWKTQGYTHVMLSLSGYNFIRDSDTRITPEMWEMFGELLENLPEPEKVAPGYRLYQLDIRQ